MFVVLYVFRIEPRAGLKFLHVRGGAADQPELECAPAASWVMRVVLAALGIADAAMTAADFTFHSVPAVRFRTRGESNGRFPSACGVLFRHLRIVSEEVS